MPKVHVVHIDEDLLTDSHGAVNIPFLKYLGLQIKAIYENKERVVLVMPPPQKVGSFRIQGTRQGKSLSRSPDEMGDAYVGKDEIIAEIVMAFREFNLLIGSMLINTQLLVDKKLRSDTYELKDMLQKHQITVPILFDEKFKDKMSYELASKISVDLSAVSLIYLSSKEVAYQVVAEAQAFNQKKVGIPTAVFEKSGILKSFLAHLTSKPGIENMAHLISGILKAQASAVNSYLLEANTENTFVKLIKGEIAAHLTILPETKSLKK